MICSLCHTLLTISVRPASLLPLPPSASRKLSTVRPRRLYLYPRPLPEGRLQPRASPAPWRLFFEALALRLPGPARGGAQAHSLRTAAARATAQPPRARWSASHVSPFRGPATGRSEAINRGGVAVRWAGLQEAGGGALSWLCGRDTPLEIMANFSLKYWGITTQNTKSQGLQPHSNFNIIHSSSFEGKT